MRNFVFMDAAGKVPVRFGSGPVVPPGAIEVADDCLSYSERMVTDGAWVPLPRLADPEVDALKVRWLDVPAPVLLTVVDVESRAVLLEQSVDDGSIEIEFSEGGAYRITVDAGAEWIGWDGVITCNS